jgi:hypothetical protein
MNIGALLVLAKLAEAVGFTVSPKANGPTPPTNDDAGLKPHVCEGLAKYADPPTNKIINPSWVACIMEHGEP